MFESTWKCTEFGVPTRLPLPHAELGASSTTDLSTPGVERVMRPNYSANRQVPGEEMWSTRSLAMPRGPGFTTRQATVVTMDETVAGTGIMLFHSSHQSEMQMAMGGGLEQWQLNWS